MEARIYRPSKNTMQSGRAKTQNWVLEYENTTARRPEPLMGWTGSEDTLGQVRLKFDTLEDATAYAEKNNLYYKVQADSARKLKPRNYGDNFKYIPPEDDD
ncbi:MAG: ETC complex I subunit [Rhodospirillales bacterium]|nr:ETC complex I subunit [Rhodospirillales bacterium]